MIRNPRLGHLAVFVLLLCVAFAFFGWPQVLWILFVIPIAVVIWIERTRTKVSASGLDLRTFFGSRHIDWSQLQGVSIPKRGYVRAHLSDGSEVPLPAVGYDRLRILVEASGGRIPDPFAAAEEAEAKARAEAAAARDDAAEDTGDETEITNAAEATAESDEKNSADGSATHTA
ncbi:PH domain-containing protein [Nocardia sp. CA2R105]|uniref:PH domain-containing protein n=1 Tax=Nocardia coffeae TaxID=2873381 RepID=UPI001CA79CA3|nr:PH domain-containing protein [Nocardia coffeae]MBY8856335.1 PH domain-containing protein [Nocardia coffeae]